MIYWQKEIEEYFCMFEDRTYRKFKCVHISRPVMLTKSGISLLDTLYDLELKYRDTDSNKFKQLIVAIKVDLMNLLRENSKVNKRSFRNIVI